MKSLHILVFFITFATKMKTKASFILFSTQNREICGGFN